MTETFSLTDPIFINETVARDHFEAIRWPDGPVCPHCGSTGERTEARRQVPTSWSLQCHACREPFTVKMGSVMESSHIFYRKRALAFI